MVTFDSFPIPFHLRQRFPPLSRCAARLLGKMQGDVGNWVEKNGRRAGGPCDGARRPRGAALGATIHVDGPAMRGAKLPTATLNGEGGN